MTASTNPEGEAREVCEKCGRPKARDQADWFKAWHKSGTGGDVPVCGRDTADSDVDEAIPDCDARTIARLESALSARDEELREARARDAMQIDVYNWARSTFGEGAAVPEERALRFLEEAIELAQAEGISELQAHILLMHVYEKPAGDVRQEVGGVGVTLLAYCESRGLSANEAERAEFSRVLTKSPEHFRERHNIKARAGVATFVALSTDDATTREKT